MDELVIIKRDIHTNAAYGKAPRQRSLKELLDSGFLILDKPKGPTSNQAVEQVKSILGVETAGHIGTLDPEVSGVLPILLGKSVHAAAYLNKDKRYIGVMQLHKDIEETKIRDAFSKFIGKITQLPPVKSAVARKPREREIFELEIVEITKRSVLFRAHVEAGTYIRKLIHDVGQELGVGANMFELRRTDIREISEKDAVTPHELAEAMWLFKNENDERLLRKMVIPLEEALEYFGIRMLWVADSAVDALCSGAQLMEPGLAAFNDKINDGETVAILTTKDELVAFAKSLFSSHELTEVSRKQVAKTLRVMMERGIYPSWKKK